MGRDAGNLYCWSHEQFLMQPTARPRLSSKAIGEALGPDCWRVSGSDLEV